MKAPELFARQCGMSIIELMIGMAMGLLISIALVKSFAGNEVFNRAVTGRADAQQAGALSSWRMTRELRLAGSGIGHGPSLWGCPLQVQKNTNTLLPRGSDWPAPFANLPRNLGLVPIAISDNSGAGGSDQLVMMAGSPGANVVPAPVNIVSASQIDMNTTTGFAAGDLLLINDASSVGVCQIGQIDNTFTQSTLGTAATRTLPTTSAGAPFNTADGFNTFGAATPSGDFTIINLGNTPVMQMIGLNTNNELVMLDPLQIYTGAAPLALAQNVVQLQALYGVDDGSNGGTLNDNVIDAWVAPSGATWSYGNVAAPAGNSLWIKAVRVAMLVRSAVPSGNPGAAKRVLFPDLPAASQIEVNIPVANRAFSHEVFDMIIPLRNQVSALCSQHRRAGGIPSANGCA